MKNLSLIAALALFAGHTTSAQMADRIHTAVVRKNFIRHHAAEFSHEYS